MLKRLRVVFVAVVVLAAILAAAAPALAVHRPTRVMIVVMDQMQPGYAKQFNMSNVLFLQKKGVTFPNAWVGDMASETVVSHNVMVSGLFPKHMGWSDEGFRDVDNLLGFGENAIVTPGDLGTAAFKTLIENMDYPKLGDYLHEKFPGKVVANVGQKGYQVESMAASSSDIWVRMGGSKATTTLPDPSVVPWVGKYRGPSGSGPGGVLPTYISGDNRFLISAGNPWDTYETTFTAPAWIYPEDGRYAPGQQAGHVSGDEWVADAAIKIMDNEDWSGLWVTFSGIDKIGHLWGGGAVDTVANYHWDPTTIFNTIHMPWIAKNADNQLGRLIAELKAKGQFNDTLIIVTADHGSTYGKDAGFHGVNAFDAGNATNWYAGSWHAGAAALSTSPGSPALAPLMATGNVQFSYQSTAIETWLIDRTGAKKREAAAVMEKLPGVIATYIKDGDRYRFYSAGPMTIAESVWWVATGQQLVDTMCFSGSADVVGLLADKTSYGAFGDHGGAQQDVQRIPMAFYMPGMKHADNSAKIRLVDMMPTILKTMGIPATIAPMDGKAYTLPLPK